MRMKTTSSIQIFTLMVFACSSAGHFSQVAPGDYRFVKHLPGFDAPDWNKPVKQHGL